MMKKVLVIACICLVATFAFGAEKGGIVPGLASCFLGPRVGLEMNEGKPITTLEIIGFFFSPVRAVPGFQANGVTGGLIGCCLGPRVGGQINQRKIRTNEWLQLCCIGRVMITFEAYNGKTMTEIEQKEGLRK